MVANPVHIASEREETAAVDRLWRILDQVCDPEIPAISLRELGVIRDIQIKPTSQEKKVVVTITPTYSGCPALEVMAKDIEQTLNDNGYSSVQIENQLSPPWTTDWITPNGREKLRTSGIAPPGHINQTPGHVVPVTHFPDQVHCTHCNSSNTQSLSEFGSTPCKALYQCRDCLEPFDYFKSI